MLDVSSSLHHPPGLLVAFWEPTSMLLRRQKGGLNLDSASRSCMCPSSEGASFVHLSVDAG